MVTAVFTPEAELTLFLRMRTKKIAKSLGKCTPIEDILSYYRKSRSPERMAWSDFWPEAPKQPFPHLEILLFYVNVHESTVKRLFFNC